MKMNRYKNHSSCVLIFLFILIPLISYAGQIGSQAGAFLRMGIGADRAAIGDCGVALNSGTMNWHYNPAGLSFQKSRQVALGYRYLTLDRSVMYLDYSMPLRGNAALGFGLLRAATSNIDARDSNGERFDLLTNSENLFHGSFSLRPSQRISIGISLKWMINNTPDLLDGGKSLNVYGMGIDLGLQVKLLDNLDLGFQIRDLNSKYSWESSEVWGDGMGAKDDEFPLLLRIGAAYDPIPSLTLATDVVVHKAEVGKDSEAFDPHFGIEWRSKIQSSNEIFLRTGWDGDAPTFGLGFDLNLRYGIKARLDYAYIFENVAPSGSHIIGWLFEF